MCAGQQKKSVPKGKIEIVEQRLPGEAEIVEYVVGDRGLPDAWIHDNDCWSLIIENKVASKINNDQLRRHLNTASRRGFDNVTLLVIDVIDPVRKLPKGVLFKKWSDVYDWLYKQSNWSYWAKKVLQYMEVAESKWPDDKYLLEGTLTKFSGIPFTDDNPYNYPEAKRLIRLLMDELRKNTDLKRHLGMDPAGQGRGMITGKGANVVWDFLRLKGFGHEKDFIRTAHLTLGIQSESWSQL